MLFFKSEAETKNWKPLKIRSVHCALQDYYREKHDKNFNEDFPEACQFIAKFIRKQYRSKPQKSHGRHNQGIGSLTKIGKQSQKYTENLWKKLCEMTKKEIGFTDAEMISFFKLESKRNNWKPSTLFKHHRFFAKLYRKKCCRIFKKDFPKTYLYT